MKQNAPTQEPGAAGEAAKTEPRDTQVETLRKQVRIPGPGVGKVIVSGRPNFLITRSQAEALVAEGLVRIVEG